MTSLMQRLNEIFGYDQYALNAIWRLTLRHVLTEPLELKILYENIAFVQNNKYKKHNFTQLLRGHNYAHLKSGAFSLAMSIIKSGICW